MPECKLQWLAMQQQQYKSVRGHSERHALPVHPNSPSDLLMVDAVCSTHTVSVAD